jgi:hypothetical protein
MTTRNRVLVVATVLLTASLALLLAPAGAAPGAPGQVAAGVRIGLEPSPALAGSLPAGLTPGAPAEAPLAAEPPAAPPSPPAAPARVAPGAVQLRVVDLTGAPIRDAQLTALDPTDLEPRPVGETDDDGRALLDPSPALVRVDAAGFVPRQVASGALAGAELVVTLTPARRLVGRVVTAEDGGVLPGARVTTVGGEAPLEAETDIFGGFVLEGVAADAPAVILRASALGRVPALFEVAYGTAAELPLARGDALRGSVLDPEGRPVAAELFIFAQPGPLDPATTTSDRDGRFELEGLPPGSALLAIGVTPAAATDLAALEPLSASVGPGAPATIREAVVRLTPRPALRLTGLPPGPLALRPEGPIDLPFLARDLVVDATGEARLARLVPGWYRLWRGEAQASDAFRIPPGSSLQLGPDEVGFTHARAGPELRALRVRVVDEAGRPVAGASVTAGTTAASGADGVALVAIAGDGATVVASAPGRVLVAPLHFFGGAPPAEVELVLATAARLSGRVTGLGAAGGATLALRWAKDDAPLAGGIMTDEAGAFALDGLPSGEVVVEVTAQDGRTVTCSVHLPQDDLRLPLPPTPIAGSLEPE